MAGGAPPPRLTVLAARDADVAVVVRRGPTAWSRLYRWDTTTDQVEPGGWLHAVVKHRRVDLSPDGRLLVCLVQRHGSSPGDHTRETWTAISRPPWWTALALWFDGTAWGFGGCFPDAASCAGTGPGPPDVGEVPAWFDASAALPEVPDLGHRTDATVAWNRRVRDGWVRRDTSHWERPLADGGHAVTLESVDGLGRVTTEHALRHGDRLSPLGAGASLDVDRSGRALVCRDGRFEVHVGDRRSLVHDTAGEVPDPRPSPAWAARWPAPP